MAGYLTKGVWTPGDPHRTDAAGRFVRAGSQFRNWITADGVSGFAAEPNRYVLCVSFACPWAHRTLISRSLLGLQEVIAVWSVDPVSGADGWVFAEPPPGAPLDRLRAIHQLYTLHQPDYSGLATVPVLWDRVTRRIVNNESAEIVRMLNGAFAASRIFGRDLYPESRRSEIAELNSYVYETVNNGVYGCGFAKSETAYRDARQRLFAALDLLERLLGSRRYLLGPQITEADVRLFPTLVRFDAVYHRLFKCNLRRIADYPNLTNYLRDIYQLPGVAETVNLQQIKRHYYLSHPKLNPDLSVPDGPELDFSDAHDCHRFS